MESRGYSVVRPVEYAIGSFTPGLTESAVNIFRMEFDPTDFSETRASWQIRSPGLNSLMSAQVFVEFDLQITTRGKVYDFASALGPNVQLIQNNNADATATHIGHSAKLAFAQGNPFKAAQQSYQLVVNGASLQQTRMDEWSNCVEKMWIPSSVMQRRFGRCGGAWSEWDGVAVSGDALVVAAANAGRDQGALVAGFTQDSGVAKRIRGLLACTKAVPTKGVNGSVRVVRVRCPLEGCGILNPLGRGDTCANSCPLKSASFVIPHMNVIGCNLLFRNLFKTIVKNLSSYTARAGAARPTVALWGRQRRHCCFPRRRSQSETVCVLHPSPILAIDPATSDIEFVPYRSP